MEFVKTKTILSKVKYGNQWYGIDYNMNLYRGCSHGCIYCDSRSDCYQVANFDTVRGKENALEILEQELAKKKQKGVVAIGAMSDTYNPKEQDYQITRGALMLLKKYGFGVSIDTKSDLLLRDMDILEELSIANDVIVKFTITTPHDELSKVIEPHVCPSSARFAAVKALNKNGIFAGIMMNPVLPFITDSEDDIRHLVQLAKQNSAKFVLSYMGVTLRENQREYYYQKLDENFKGLKEKYMYQYGNRYSCAPVDSRKLYNVFKEACHEHGLLYRMSDIIKAYKRPAQVEEQLTLDSWFVE